MGEDINNGPDYAGLGETLLAEIASAQLDLEVGQEVDLVVPETRLYAGQAGEFRFSGVSLSVPGRSGSGDYARYRGLGQWPFASRGASYLIWNRHRGRGWELFRAGGSPPPQQIGAVSAGNYFLGSFYLRRPQVEQVQG